MAIRKHPFFGIGLAACSLLTALTPPVLALELVLQDTWCSDLNAPTRIACDSSTHLIYVTCPRSGEIVVFDSLGTIQDVIESVNYPTAIAADGQGHLIVADRQAVREIATDGTPVLTVGGSETYFLRPHDVAVGQDGRIYVSDVNDTIKIFDAGGGLVGAFGGYGWFSGLLDDPVAMAVRGHAGELYVADQNNGRIQVYDTDGVFRRTWGALGNGDYAPGEFLRLWGIDLDEQEHVWAFDDVLNAIQVFDTSGEFLAMFELDEPQLRTGLDIAIDGDKLFLTSQSLHCILVYWISQSDGGNGSEIFDLTICRASEGIQLRWSPVAGAVGYDVFRSSDPAFPEDSVEYLGEVSDTSLLDSEVLSLWDKGFYEVAAVLGYAGCDNAPPPPSAGLNLAGWTDEDRRTFSHDRPHTVTYGVRCTSCHFSHFNYPDPLPEWWFGDHLCKSCHVETGKARPAQNHFSAADTMYCDACHDPHRHQDQFERYYIRSAITTPNSGDWAVAFNHATDFIHGEPSYDGICEACHTLTNHHRNNSSGGHGHHQDHDCTACHGHIPGSSPEGGSCSACHESPPPTGAHLVHVGMPEADVAYGDLRQTSDYADSAAVYMFGCGNCHPANNSYHQNGTLDIELFDSTLPPHVLKALNPPTASYTPGSEPFTDDRGFTYTLGTCSDIYCHSSGQVAEFQTYSDAYWGRAEPYGCGDCHGEPPTYESQGAGEDGANTHYQFGVLWGSDEGHILGIHWFHDSTTVADSLGTVLNCNVCHHATTTSDRNVGFGEGDGNCGNCHDVTTDPPFGNRGTITNAAWHVSGTPEVEFTPVPFRSAAQMSSPPPGWTRHGYPNGYDETNIVDLSTYEVETKTCYDVPCHLNQTSVQWGLEWDCNACHQYLASKGSHAGRLDGGAECTDCHPGTIHTRW
jgi:predicted CxxxxCH...CXXCH cytochrome family protein